MNLSQLTEYDTFLFHQGTNCKAYEMLGAHITEEDILQGRPGEGSRLRVIVNKL